MGTVSGAASPPFSFLYSFQASSKCIPEIVDPIFDGWWKDALWCNILFISLSVILGRWAGDKWKPPCAVEPRPYTIQQVSASRGARARYRLISRRAFNLLSYRGPPPILERPTSESNCRESWKLSRPLCKIEACIYMYIPREQTFLNVCIRLSNPEMSCNI